MKCQVGECVVVPVGRLPDPLEPVGAGCLREGSSARTRSIVLITLRQVVSMTLWLATSAPIANVPIRVGTLLSHPSGI